MTIERLAEIIAAYGWNHIITQGARARYYYEQLFADRRSIGK